MRLYLILVSFFITCASEAQSLEDYIQEGLRNSDNIKQQDLMLDKSFAAVREARTFSKPTIEIEEQFLDSHGGRRYVIPTSQIMNPVYKTLNQLTGTDHFPQIGDAYIPANPQGQNNFKIKFSYPLYNREIYFNQAIKKAQFQIQEIDRDLNKRELVFEIKKAYYQYIKAEQVSKIYSIAINLAKENLRINQHLYENEKINRTGVLHTQTELATWYAKKVKADADEKNAQAYFNFLLKQPLQTQIHVDSICPAEIPLLLLADSLVYRREECRKIETAGEIASYQYKLQKARFAPKVGSFVETGVQGTYLHFNDQPFYYFLGISISYPLFASGRKHYSQRQALDDQDINTAKADDLKNQLLLQIFTIITNLKASISNYQSVVSQVETAKKFQSDILNMYKQGSSLFIEVLDAQNNYTTSLLQQNIDITDIEIKLAELERATASYQLN